LEFLKIFAITTTAKMTVKTKIEAKTKNLFFIVSKKLRFNFHPRTPTPRVENFFQGKLFL